MGRKQIYSPVHIYTKDKPPDKDTPSIHCHKRIRIMLTLGILSRKIVEKKKITEVNISFEGAKIQDGRGNRQIKTEAAHNIPRNVLINGTSTWEYINDPECNFHERIKKQLFLLSASTVIVKREVNYLDSQWENNGILDVFANYMYECMKLKIDSENEQELLLEAGKNFIDGCKGTFNKTIKAIKTRKVYQNKKDILDEIFQKFYHTIEHFNYAHPIKIFLDIYSLPQYK